MTIGGTTSSEKYLAKLCNGTFLSLWSYPNVFNDNGIVNGRGIGKEITDLLVVFGNDIIIFSDKSCEYKYTDRLAIDWNRWYRKAIEKSMSQLYGAERWIKSFPDRIFLDASCQKPFPLELPDPQDMRIHRVAIATGISEMCRSFYGGGSGSLRISTDIYPIMESDDEYLKAFTTGYADKSKGYVHVFDDITLDVVLGELDTIEDFCAYLRKKEELFQKIIISAGGEEDLLGLYLKTMDPDGNHGFGIDTEKYDSAFIPEGEWAELISSSQYKEKKELDKASYIWDELIEHFNKTHLSNELTVAIATNDYEKVIHEMAALSRVERRMVGSRFEEVLKNTPSDQTRYSAAVLGKDQIIAFALVLTPPPEGRTYSEYRRFRANLLSAYSNILKYKVPSLQKVIGIAMEPHKRGRGGSEDLGYFDFGEWGDEQKQQAISDMEMLRVKAEANYFKENEYPS